MIVSFNRLLDIFYVEKMKKYFVKVPLVLFVLIFESACSTEQIYNAFRENRVQECQPLRGSERERCLESVEDTHDEYQEKRKNT